MKQPINLLGTPEPEPQHGTCCRCIMCPAAVISFAPAAIFLPPLILAAPIEFCLVGCCHVACCKYCCKESVHQFSRNVVCTPCRWGRIACCGVGQIGCAKYPAWPFR